jgi:hypothetical protein
MHSSISLDLISRIFWPLEPFKVAKICNRLTLMWSGLPKYRRSLVYHSQLKRKLILPSSLEQENVNVVILIAQEVK